MMKVEVKKRARDASRSRGREMRNKDEREAHNNGGHEDCGRQRQ